MGMYNDNTSPHGYTGPRLGLFTLQPLQRAKSHTNDHGDCEVPKCPHACKTMQQNTNADDIKEFAVMRNTAVSVGTKLGRKAQCVPFGATTTGVKRWGGGMLRCSGEEEMYPKPAVG